MQPHPPTKINADVELASSRDSSQAQGGPQRGSWCRAKGTVAPREEFSGALEAGRSVRLARLLSKAYRPLVRWEKRAHAHLRKFTAAGRFVFAAGMIAMYAFAVVLPLIVAQSRSYKNANRICFFRFADRWQEMGAGVLGSKNTDPAPWDREYEFGKVPEKWNAHLVLLPGHYFHCVSAFVSLAGALYWLFLSPHYFSCNEKVLDRKLMTFFLGQFASDVAVITCSTCFCAPGKISYIFLFNMYNGAFFGASLLATNFFSVRYLFEKARLAARCAPPGAHFWSIRLLAGLFDAEIACTLAIVPVGCVIMMIAWFQPVAMDVLMVFLACYTGCLIVVDGLFSVGLHAIFLHPINALLGGRTASRLKKMRWVRAWTLIGASLCVVSSSILYVDCLLGYVSITQLLMEGDYLTSPWRDPQIFSGNLDNVLNVAGMVLVSAAVSTNPDPATIFSAVRAQLQATLKFLAWWNRSSRIEQQFPLPPPLYEIPPTARHGPPRLPGPRLSGTNQVHPQKKSNGSSSFEY